MFCNMLRALEIIFLFKFLNVFGNPVLFNCTTNVGNCTNNNELCEFIPLPHILCKFEKVKENCPRTCNSCPEALEPETFIMSEKNGLCGSAQIVLDANLCRSAVPNTNYKGEEDDPNWPKGCYKAEYADNNDVYFNNHPTGKKNPSARQICYAADQVSYSNDQTSVYNSTDSDPLDEKNQFYNDSSSNEVDYTVHNVINGTVYNLRCSLEKNEGACLDQAWISHYTRWYYDSGIGECKEFVFTGCGGNRNNFESRDLCMSACSEEMNNGTYPEMEDMKITSTTNQTTIARKNTTLPTTAEMYAFGIKHNSKCASGYSPIKTIDECKTAAKQLKNMKNKNVKYDTMIEVYQNDIPKGCYLRGYFDGNVAQPYFNYNEAIDYNTATTLFFPPGFPYFTICKLIE